MILLTAFFAFLLPIGALVYWRKRTGLGIVPFAAGALCFLLFAMGLEQVLHSFCLVSDNPVSRVIKSSPWITALYGCLAAGICEESGRLFGFRLLLRRQKAREVSVAYGIGHGGIESILTLGLTYVILALASFGITMGDAGTDEMLRQTISTASSGTLLLAMFERAEKWCVHAGPGHWPDADMLPVGALRQCYAEDDEGAPFGERAHRGWTNFTQEEQRTMMTLWCMLRSPLMIGAEMTKNDEFTLALLTNREVLDIEKQSWCAHPVFTSAEECVWIAPRKDGTGCYVAAFNLSGKARKVGVDAEWLEQPFARATELWTGKAARKGLSARLAPHDAAVWKVKW